MATSTSQRNTLVEKDLPVSVTSSNHWLKDKRWDMTFIIFSIALVPIPYLTWIVMGSNDAARQAVNLGIAVLIGGPHMVATFSRTAFDKEFRSKYPLFIASSLLIPFVVVALALYNMSILLTIFFSIAAIHVIQQAVYIIESYNRKERDPQFKDTVMSNQRYSWKKSLTTPYYLIDFVFIASALFPVANLKMVHQEFIIGQTSLNAAIPSFFEQMWTVYLASAIFGISGIAFFVKSFVEYRSKTLNLPKFLFVFATAAALFVGPMLGNLDTSFQGINTWHSFQYLALTWYAINLRNKAKKDPDHPQSKKKTLLEELMGDGNIKKFYLFNFLLTVGVGALIVIAYVALTLSGGQYANHSHALEVAYYIGVLSILWQHYYHDNFLFTQTDSLVP